mgnify:FL=1
MNRRMVVPMAMAMVFWGLLGCEQEKPVAGEMPGTAPDVTAEQRQEYIRGATQIVEEFERDAAALRERVGSETEQLANRLEAKIAEAREALNNLEQAEPERWAQAKVAVDEAINHAEATLRQLQVAAEGPPSGTPSP